MAKTQLVGTYRLISSEFRVSSGEVIYPLGKDVAGLIIFDAKGNMSAQLMRPDRPRFASDDMLKGTPEEIKAAVEGYVAYFGTYKIDEEKGTVTTTVKGSLYPNWVGGEQLRYFEFSGNGLTLKTQPILAGDVTLTGVLIWERLA